MSFLVCVRTKTLKGQSQFSLRIDSPRWHEKTTDGIIRPSIAEQVDTLRLMVPTRFKRGLVVEADEKFDAYSTNS